MCSAQSQIANRAAGPSKAGWLQPPEVPKACSQADIARYGRPVMFPGRAGVAHGVSSVHDHFKKTEQIYVYIWVSNESANEQRYSACCEMTFLNYFDLVDSAGHSMASRRSPIFECDCSALPVVSSSSCKVIDGGTLNRPDTAYTLLPGRYTIVGREQRPNPGPAGSLTSPEGHSMAKGLVITIGDE
jgi:hypothetical protein